MDYQALGQKLIEKNFQSTQPIWKLKKSYEHYKGMLDDAKELVNKDTRAAKIFKEALKSALKWASGLVGEDLTKNPYYVLNQKGLDALFEAITAMDTINNSRKLISDAEASFEKLESKVRDFRSESYDKHKEFYDGIKMQLSKVGWIKYMEELNLDRFWKDTRAEAESEVENALNIAESLLKDLKPTVDRIIVAAPKVYANYAALVAAGGSIVLAEKTAEEKVAKLADSKSTISHGFGTFEQARQRTERDLQGLYNEKSGGKSLAYRVYQLFEPVNAFTIRDWNDLVRWSISDRVLMIGVAGAGELPWNLPLPAA